MGRVLDLLKEKKILISDGAWGTMLQAKGMTSDDCPEEWNISHAEEVKSVAAAYAAAGSDMVLSNTFGGSSIKLKKFGFEGRVAELNLAGIKNSVAGAGGKLVAGSVGPTGEFMQPLGLMSAEEMEQVFSEQIAAMIEGGVDAVCIETFTAIEEAVCAVKAAKKINSSIDVITTFTFDPTPNGFKTMMGIGPEDVYNALTDAGADIIGSNCGNGIDQMVGIVEEYRKATDMPLLIHANAGLPELVDGKTVFRQSPADMAAKTEALINAGANIIGGCCGTTPDHIAAIKDVVDKFR